MDAEIRFEEALHQLEGAVAALEGGELGLDEALAHYEQGIRLLGRCRALLEGAERKVALLTGVAADGQPETAPFDASATAPTHTPARPARGRTRPAPPIETDDVDPPF